MTASIFGASIADCTVVGGAIDPSTTVTFWTAQTGGSQITSLTLNGVGVTSITTLADGSFPLFLETTGTFNPMWADAGGRRLQIWSFPTLGGTAGGAVASVYGRTGAIVAATNDYAVAQVTGAAPLASPTFTGTPAAPTPTTSDNTTKVATTAFVKAQAYATLASPALTGTPTVPTQSPGDASTKAASTAYVDAAVAAAIAALQIPLDFSSAGLSAPTTTFYRSFAASIQVGTCLLQGSPTGTNLVFVLQQSTNGGSTWSTVQSLTITAGSTTPVSANPAASIVGPSLLRGNITAIGGGCPWTFEAIIT